MLAIAGINLLLLYIQVEGKIKNFKLDLGSKNKTAGKQGNS